MLKNFTKALFVMTALLFLGVALFAESTILSLKFENAMEFEEAHGTWVAMKGRLYQTDTENRLAKINAPAVQTGTMRYEFDVRYEAGGIEDMMGGFGLHVFVDKAYDGRSWGNGNSYLLWLNYDQDATYGGTGFRAQVYKSTSNKKMVLLEGYDLPIDESVLTTKNMAYIIPMKIIIDGNTGVVKVYDPTRANYYYAFKLDTAPKFGSFVSFRTNSLSVSFDNIKITREK